MTAAASDTEKQAKFVRSYAVVTFYYLLWFALWGAVSDLFDPWIIILFLILVATVPVALYLLAGLAMTVFRLQPRRILSVVFGPLAAAAVVFAIVAFMSATGFTTDYARFLWRRSEFMSRIAAANSKDQPPFMWNFYSKGGILTWYFTTVVIYDPSRQLLLWPERRSPDWRQRLEKDGSFPSGPSGNQAFFHPGSVAEYKEHVTIRRLEGDFYAVKFE